MGRDCQAIAGGSRCITVECGRIFCLPCGYTPMAILESAPAQATPVGFDTCSRRDSPSGSGAAACCTRNAYHLQLARRFPDSIDNTWSDCLECNRATGGCTAIVDVLVPGGTSHHVALTNAGGCYEFAAAGQLCDTYSGRR